MVPADWSFDKMREQLHQLDKQLDQKNERILQLERDNLLLTQAHQTELTEMERKNEIQFQTIERLMREQIPHPEPKFRVNQVVMTLRPTNLDVQPTDPRYREDDRLVRITAFGWFRESPYSHKYLTQYNIEGGTTWIPEVWIRALTDSERG